MKLNVFFSPVIVDELYFTGKTTVIIDVLRATSTIITAIDNGAKEIVPVATVEFAVKVSGGMFGGQTLLGGERNTKKIEGFALGNSPFEYSKEVVENKSIVFYTTNGTKAIAKAKYSENLFACSFLNITAIVNQLISLQTDVEIICSGRNNYFSLEDSVCAGMLVSKLKNHYNDFELNDSAKASLILYEKLGGDILQMLKTSEHGKILIENGFEADLEYCSKIDMFDIVAYYSSGVLKKLKNT
ncbi:MAG: 2-phosphosulfolactate phosphatase [Ignavibacteriaceae bacterium]